MIGIIVYIYFLFIGFLYATAVFRDKDIYFRGWMGGIFGNVLMMIGVVPFAFIFGFNVCSHIALIIAAAIPVVILYLRDKNKKAQSVPAVTKKSGKGTKTKELAEDRGIFSGLFDISGSSVMGPKVFFFLVIPITILIGVLLTNHILTPYEGGGVSSGQSTYGDLAFHLGIVTSIAEQGKFPPEYNILSGTQISYPFFINMLSASLVIFGTPLRWAVLIPSYVFSMLLVMGFYFTAHKMTGRKGIAVLAVLLFFFNGGFGFAYFFEGAKADPTKFTRIFTEYYQTPTNYNDMNIRWANTICDMIVPQRTTMAGWTVLMPALWMLIDAFQTKKFRAFVLIGIFAGCMPMIHTHSFMGIAVISGVMCIAAFFGEKDKPSFFKNWGAYAGIAAAIALPQLIIWTFGQASGEGFMKIQLDWVNENDPWLWFWLKNLGVILIALIPAFLGTSKQNKLLMAGGAVMFLIAEIIQFQPLTYDNNKLFFVTYIIAVIICAEFFVKFYEAIKTVKGRQVIAAATLVCCFLSGVLTIGREYHSGGMYQTFSDADIEFAEFVKENTEKDAVFATYTHHLNPVSVLAGRSLYAGTSLFLTFHGFGDEQARRAAIVEEMYESDNVEEIRTTSRECGISYILMSSYERNNYDINSSVFDELEKVYDRNGIELYKVS